MFRLSLFSLGVAAQVAAVSLTASGQAGTVTSSITGVVRDQAGALVPNAQLTATGVDTGFTRSARSGTDGTYSLPLLPEGV